MEICAEKEDFGFRRRGARAAAVLDCEMRATAEGRRRKVGSRTGRLPGVSAF
jgi:hypothetical protein